jgi:hypothetical protein
MTSPLQLDIVLGELRMKIGGSFWGLAERIFTGKQKMARRSTHNI